MNKRKEIATKLYVKLNSGPLTSWGLLYDVSENGLFIRSNRDFATDALIDIQVFMQDKSIIFLKGVVRRITELPEQHRKFGIGVELKEKDTTYKHFLKFLEGRIEKPYADITEAVF